MPNPKRTDLINHLTAVATSHPPGRAGFDPCALIGVDGLPKVIGAAYDAGYHDARVELDAMVFKLQSAVAVRDFACTVIFMCLLLVIILALLLNH